MSANRVLVAGASGMFGHTLVPILRKAGYEVIAHGSAHAMDVTADLTDAPAAYAILDRVMPGTIVNLVALTNVDRCEEYPNEAYRLNVCTVETLAGWIGRGRARHLIQVSTDQVYDGHGPHCEQAVTITNTYALSKYAGELAALRVNSTVLRTNFFGPSRSENRKSFSDGIIAKLQGREAFVGFDDVLFSPLSMATLSQMILRVVEQPVVGVFNLGAREGFSKAVFAEAVANRLGLDSTLMRRGSCAEVKLKAYRPRDMRMDCRHFETTFGVTLPSVRSEIEQLEGFDAPAER